MHFSFLFIGREPTLITTAYIQFCSCAQRCKVALLQIIALLSSPTVAARFLQLSEGDLSCLIERKNSESTKKATTLAVSVFRQYLEERKFDEKELLTSEVKQLQRFRSEEKEWRVVHKSFTCANPFWFLALKRWILSNTPSSPKSTLYLKRKIAELKREGKAQTQHKPTRRNYTKLS